MRTTIHHELEEISRKMPLFSISEKMFSTLSEALKSGEKIELVPFKQWQEKQSIRLNLANRSDKDSI